ncbi:vacuolar-type H+-ATPase subunit I/STV1 [Caldalkalibacillus uzonensis]|uniref:Vacuolar-type H+-ATPase subunit I/STV1 n=1 Tax=Caldalkalibacillus uzonensis TaxID=353224 RepID=A0ABU0CNX3_9BACI|nr:tripartite tricarboxylate transporter TctB family protein [Caldalkalibacillus uzonensis]MDQ0338113.1 vacuolar-type H+-ATPase subunit I/STV1 [Caldalkalibacillus uzonensis]
MIKKYGDIYASIFLIIFSVIMYLATFTFERLTVSRIGSEFVPQLTSIGIFILSISLLIKGIKRMKSDNNHQSERPSFRYFTVIATIVLIAVYIALMREIGFLLMTVVYLFAQFYVLAGKSKRNLPLFLVLSIAVSVTVYYVFRYGFNLLLPAGILG